MVMGQDFEGHQIFKVGRLRPNDPLPANNIVVDVADPNLKWVNHTTAKLGEWRDRIRSIYIAWALTINGIHVARDKYSDSDWLARGQFNI